MHIGIVKTGTRFYAPAAGVGATTTDEQRRDAPDPPSDPAAADPPATAPHAAEAERGAGSVDQIRDIIFGVQMREYDTRFGRLEERLLKESAALRDETSRRFDALDAFVRQQFEALGERLSGEQRARAHAVQELAQRITDLVQHVERRTTQIDEQASHNQRTLQQQLQEQSDSLATEIRTRFDALSAMLDRQTSALRDEKADRASLATLLTELAHRLHPESAGRGTD